MGMIINIDQALELRSDYNILREPLNEMLKNKQEAWETKNPIDLLFVRNTISTFQETYTSSIGFDHAFAETSDMGIGPIFNTAEGFSATYRTRTFQGGFVITQQTLEDRQLGKVKDDATQFVKRWHGDVVEYAITAISGGFGNEVTWGSATNGGESRLKLMSADTVDGDINNTTKNPLFSKAHTIVKRKTMSAAEVTANLQSNLFRAAIDTTNTDKTAGIAIGSSDAGQVSKLADVIYQVISQMENYRDDNNKIAGVTGAKTIVTGNDPHLKQALMAAITAERFGDMPNLAKDIANVECDPYFNLIPQTRNGVGFFVVDKAYNAENHGPEFTERLAFTLDVTEEKRPKAIYYDGRQRFDINVASWRGIAYVMIKAPSTTSTDWNYYDKFTPIVPAATIAKPVTVVGTVSTKEQA